MKYIKEFVTNKVALSNTKVFVALH